METLLKQKICYEHIRLTYVRFFLTIAYVCIQRIRKVFVLTKIKSELILYVHTVHYTFN